MFEMVLGHLVGDYLLQNNWMALNKSKYSMLGWLACTVHCLLYTLAVCLLMWKWSLIWATAVFLSHFVLDKFGLPDKWLKLIRGRSIEKFLSASEGVPYTPLGGIQAGFTAFVYAVADNTMHILLMWGAWKLLFT